MEKNRYAVVICPVCRRAFGMEQKVAKTTCPRCLKGFPGSMPRRVAACDESHEMAKLIAQVNAQLEGGEGDDGFMTMRLEGHDRVKTSPKEGDDGVKNSGGGSPGGEITGSGGHEGDRREGDGCRLEKAAFKASRAGPQRERALALAMHLSEELGAFDAGQFAEAARMAGLRGNPEEWLKRMMDASEICEPSPGVFRSLEAGQKKA